MIYKLRVGVAWYFMLIFPWSDNIHGDHRHNNNNNICDGDPSLDSSGEPHWDLRVHDFGGAINMLWPGGIITDLDPSLGI